MAESRSTRGGAEGRGRRLRVGVAIAVVVVAAMAVDFSITQRSVAEVPPLTCDPVASPACNDERNDLLSQRDLDSYELGDDMRSRFWIYALALIGAAGALTILSLRAVPPTGRRDAFTDLGVAGVAWLAIAFALYVVLDRGGGLLDPPAEPMYAPAIAMIAGAAAGTLLLALFGARLAGANGAAGPAQDRGATAPGAPARETGGDADSREAVRFGLGLTAGSVAFAVISVYGRGECGTDDPSWTGALLGLAALAALGAAAAGFVALFKRRWIAALICITVGPFFVVVATLAGACLS